MRKVTLFLFLAALGASSIAACDDDTTSTPAPPGSDASSDSPTTPGNDGGGPTTDGQVGNDAAQDGGPQEFTAYVKDLIENHTKNDTTPDDVASKTFVDSEEGKAAKDSTTFPASFFP